MKPFHLLILLMLTAPGFFYKPNLGVINITFVDLKLTHPQAEKHCTDKGRAWFLAMPKNNAQSFEMNDTLRFLKQGCSRVAWVGLKRVIKDKDRTGDFEFSDGTRLKSWHRWESYQPSGLKSSIQDQDCVEMRIINNVFSWDISKNNFNGWNDQQCDKERVFFCQYDPNVPYWAAWTSYPCSVTCDGQGKQHKNRTCIRPQDTGNCPGESELESNCVAETPCPAAKPAEWTEWTFGECSATCGEGLERHERKCVGVGRCVGETEKTSAVKCWAPPCKVAPWGPWGACSVTCGVGEKSRAKDCTGGGTCEAPHSDTQICHPATCPGVPPCSDNGGCSHTCVEKRGKPYCKCPQGFKIGENKLTCEEPKKEDETTTEAPQTDDQLTYVIAAVAVVSVLVLALLVACCFLYKYCCGSKRQERTTEHEGESSRRVRFSKQSSQRGQKSQTSRGTSRGTGVDKSSDSSSSSGSSGSTDTSSS